MCSCDCGTSSDHWLQNSTERIECGMTDHTLNETQTTGPLSETISEERLQQLNIKSVFPNSSNFETQKKTEQNTLPISSVAKQIEATNQYATAGAVPIKNKNTRGVHKVLPPIPDSETEAAMLSSVNKQYDPVITGGGSYGQFHLEYILMTEYNNLYKQNLLGIYVIPSALSLLVWNGVIFIRQGFYQNAVFRFSLRIPENYPCGDCPRVFFEFPVFHPIVDPKTGELNVLPRFHKWRQNHNYLWQVLLYIRRIFLKIDPQCPLNAEAAEMYKNNMDQFKQKVMETIKSSNELLYNPVESHDAHMIRFSPWNSGVHEAAKSEILAHKIKLSTKTKLEKPK